MGRYSKKTTQKVQRQYVWRLEASADPRKKGKKKKENMKSPKYNSLSSDLARTGVVRFDATKQGGFNTRTP